MKKSLRNGLKGGPVLAGRAAMSGAPKGEHECRRLRPWEQLALPRTGGVLCAVGIFTLIYSVFFLGFSAWQKIPNVSAQDLCQVPVDAVLVMDTSGSMAEGGSESACQWEYYELIDIPTNTYGYNAHSESGLSQSECNSRCLVDDPFCRFVPIYTSGTPNKIESAKTAAKNFLSDMGSSDQSALVSFSDSAILVKLLSGEHDSTGSAVDGLTTNGSTNIGGAIETAIGELGSGRANPQAVKAIILLTDGKANRPNGDGYNENPADVAYAEAKAAEAAALGYKIFTIGLGTDGEINETMLQTIANTTGAQYYHASNGDDLSGIYDRIAFAVCQYGSITGCKYSDLNNNGVINEGEPKLSGWEIILGGSATSTQSTDENGCYVFSGLSAGHYTVSEGANLDKQPFKAAWPVSGQYQTDLIEGQNVINFNFANYLPVCGNSLVDRDNGETCDEGALNGSVGHCNLTCNGQTPTINQNIISGYKYRDSDGIATTTNDRVGLIGWVVNLFSSANTSTPLLSTTTNSTGYFEFNNLAAGLYSLVENLISGWTQLLAPNQINLTGTSTVAANNNFINYLRPSAPVCGNSVVETGEICDEGALNGSVGHCNLTCSGQTPTINQNIISGFKYWDRDGVASTTEDREGRSGWLINLFLSANTSTPLTSTTTNSIGYFEFNNLAAGSYSLTENLILGWTQLLAPSAINLVGTSTISSNNNFVNATTSTELVYQCSNGIDDDGDGLIDSADPGCHADNNPGNSSSYNPNDNNEVDSPVCGNTIKEGSETCDEGALNGSVGHCSSTCSGQTPTDGGGGGGGGGGPVTLSIFNEQSSNITDHTVTITWQTNLFATSRVIYEVKNGTAPCDFNPSLSPNFSFASSTAEDGSIVTGHQMNLAGLLADTTYCYHVISHVSLPDKVGNEFIFHTTGQRQPPASSGAVITEPLEFGVGGGPITPRVRVAPSVGPQGEVAGITITAPKDGEVASDTVEVLPDVAGAQAQCRPLGWWNVIILLIIYLLLALTNGLGKVKDKLQAWRPWLGWLFAILLVVLPAVAFWFCPAWVWWVWVMVIFYYFLIIVVYLFGSISENHWPTTALLTLFLIFLLLVIKNCLC